MSPKKKVVIIDDDPTVLDSVKAALEANNFDISTALSGKEGLELVSNVEPDFVLCDIMMEQIDTGIGTASQIRQKYQNVPIYLLSDIGQVTSLNIDIYELGFNGVLQKPVSTDELVSIVKTSV